MAHIYENKTTGQVITSDDPLEHLEGVARWAHSEGKAPKQDKAVEIPSGKPEKGWTVAQLEAYAERENISLKGVSGKEDVFGVIERHVPGQPVDNGPSVEGQKQSFPKPGTPAPK